MPLDQALAPRGAAAGARARQAPFPELAKRLSIVDDRRNALAIAGQWGLIGIFVAAGVMSAGWAVHWVVVAAAVILIASRQQAISVLIHDAAHYRLFGNRRLNDAMSDIFCAFPLGVVTARYRATHLLHHLEPMGENDPDWVMMRKFPREWSWPKAPRAVVLTLLGDLCGLGAIAYLRQWNHWFPLANHFGRAASPPPLSWEIRLRLYATYGVAAGLIIGLGCWREFLLYWVLPMVTVSQVMLRVRAISEHMGCGEGAGAGVTRNVEAGWVERVLISPFNVNHHLTHHIFPGVPWYNLPKLTRILNDDPRFRADAFVSSSYLGRDGVVRGELTRAVEGV